MYPQMGGAQGDARLGRDDLGHRPLRREAGEELQFVSLDEEISTESENTESEVHSDRRSKSACATAIFPVTM